MPNVPLYVTDRADVRIYVSHATVFVYDAFEKQPANAWSSTHYQQKFSRRPSTLNVVALVEEDGFIVEVIRELPDSRTSSRIVSTSLFSESGRLLLDGGDGSEVVIWEGTPGWVRVTVGQSLIRADEPQELQITAIGESAGAESETHVIEDGTKLPGPLLEHAEEA